MTEIETPMTEQMTEQMTEPKTEDLIDMTTEDDMMIDEQTPETMTPKNSTMTDEIEMNDDTIDRKSRVAAEEQTMDDSDKEDLIGGYNGSYNMNFKEATKLDSPTPTRYPSRSCSFGSVGTKEDTTTEFNTKSAQITDALDTRTRHHRRLRTDFDCSKAASWLFHALCSCPCRFRRFYALC